MTDFERVARTIDMAGLKAVETTIARVAIDARRNGAPAAIVDVLADDSQPEVARLRAFARLHAWSSAKDATKPSPLLLSHAV